MAVNMVPFSCRLGLKYSVIYVGSTPIRWLVPTVPFIQQSRDRTKSQKHYDIRWRKERRENVIKIDLPDYQKMWKDAKMTPDEQRSHMKKEGILPPIKFDDPPLTISSTSTVFEPYVPPEGDGKQSLISTEGTKQRLKELGYKGKSFREVRKIKRFDEDFSTKSFVQEAMDLYIETHDLLQNVKENEDRLHDIVSEKAYPEMTYGLKVKTLRWKFMGSIEPARVVHVRTTDMLTKDNVYGQLTVRFHTKQIMAMYDRFGRLMYGSEELVKNNLEYVVFEKHLSDIYGRWRIHTKIIPDWLPPRAPVIRTVRKPSVESPLPPVEETEYKEPENEAEGNVQLATT